jgi:hypothetical protein
VETVDALVRSPRSPSPGGRRGWERVEETFLFRDGRVIALKNVGHAARVKRQDGGELTVTTVGRFRDRDVVVEGVRKQILSKVRSRGYEATPQAAPGGVQTAGGVPRARSPVASGQSPATQGREKADLGLSLGELRPVVDSSVGRSVDSRSSDEISQPAGALGDENSCCRCRASSSGVKRLGHRRRVTS